MRISDWSSDVCSSDLVAEDWGDAAIYAGLDLSSTNDLTAFVPIAWVEEAWETKPTFWLPGDGLAEKSRSDRLPYDVWADEGLLETTPGRAIEYESVAQWLYAFDKRHNVANTAIVSWAVKPPRPWMLRDRCTEKGGVEKWLEFTRGYTSTEE